jgi:hypothetical protein
VNRRSVLIAIGALLLLMLIFSTAAIVASGIPSTHILATRADGLGFADYRAEAVRSRLSLAPLSGRIFADARRDANGEPGLAPFPFDPAAAPSSAASPSATVTPPTPSATPTATPTATPAGTAVPTPTPTPAPTPTPPLPGTLNGSVRGASTHAPVPGATITLSPGGATTTTDSKGDFTVASLPPGTYMVTASAPGYSSTSKQVVITSGGKTNVILNI